MRRLLPLLAAASLAAGCAGPDRSLAVDFKEVPSNVVLGAQSTPAPAAPVTVPSPGSQPPSFALPPPPSVVTLPPPTFEIPVEGRPVAPPLPPPPAAACPVAGPLVAPAVEAPATVELRPAKAQYVFRNSGRFEVSGADARSGAFPARSLRTVSGPAEGPSGFAFDVAESLGDVTTTTTYLVVQRRPLPTDLAPGLYVARTVSRDSAGQETVFDPTPDLQLAAFPFVRGAQVESRGVDPRTQTVMSFVSTVTGKARVDACGTPLDSFVLDLTGELVSTTQELDFTATYAIGTQYGGLVLRETVAFAGQDGDAGVSRTNTSTVNQVPRAQAGPQP